MITLKLRRYTPDELFAMLDLLAEMQIMFNALYCDDTDCRICKYRNICYDIEKVNEFIDREVDKIEAF